MDLLLFLVKEGGFEREKKFSFFFLHYEGMKKEKKEEKGRKEERKNGE